MGYTELKVQGLGGLRVTLHGELASELGNQFKGNSGHSSWQGLGGLEFRV